MTINIAMIEIKNNLTYLRLLNLFSKRISRMWSWIVNWKVPQIFPTFVKISSQQNSYINNEILYNITNAIFNFFSKSKSKVDCNGGISTNNIVCVEATKVLQYKFHYFQVFFPPFYCFQFFFYKRGNSYGPRHK